MKKLVLGLMLGSCTLLTVPTAVANTSFSATQMAQVKLDSLSFKEIMRQFYNGQMSRAFLNDEELEKMPHVALELAGGEEETTVALMHPILEYKNNNNESRYLVMIEKIKVMDDGTVVTCHACAGEADLFSFKKLSSDQYQLVSRSKKDTEFSGIWGRVGLDLKEISENIQPLGKNLVGSIFKNGYTSTGTTEMWWEALHLPENNFIDGYGIADAGADNGGSYDEDSPLYYSYDGLLEVIKNGGDYFPIKITYVGEKPTEDYEHIRKVNYSEQIKFDSVKKEYN